MPSSQSIVDHNNMPYIVDNIHYVQCGLPPPLRKLLLLPLVVPLRDCHDQFGTVETRISLMDVAKGVIALPNEHGGLWRLVHCLSN